MNFNVKWQFAASLVVVYPTGMVEFKTNKDLKRADMVRGRACRLQGARKNEQGIKSEKEKKHIAI
jgi:hypothetical protein